MQALWLEVKQPSCATRQKLRNENGEITMGSWDPDQPPAAMLALDPLTNLCQGREIKLS